MEPLKDRVRQAWETERNADRKDLLSECWVALNQHDILVSQVRNLKAVASQVSVS